MMSSRGKLLVSLALKEADCESQPVPNQDINSNVSNLPCNDPYNDKLSTPGLSVSPIIIGDNVSSREQEISNTTESPSSESEAVNNVFDLDEIIENSDDSVKDKDYLYESEEMSSDNEDVEELAEGEREHAEHAKEHHGEVVTKGRPKKGRKRKYEDQDRKIKKRNKNSNESYHSSKGQLVGSKPFIDFYCSCQNHCNTRVSAEARKQFFTHYWKLADYNVQTIFISTCVREEAIKRKTLKAVNQTKRNFSRIYMINKIAVCREMFVKTLGISSKRVNTALFKLRNLSVPDKRGVAGGHNKMSEQKRSDVISHINKFPRYKSHYCRAKRNSQEFLPTGVTVPLMYKLYKEENANNSVSLSAYRKIFLTEFNLRTKSPKKDTCNKCDFYHTKIQNARSDEEKQLASSEHDIHLKEAELARNSMKMDLTNATESDNVETLTFDMEKTLPLPRLSTNIIFYKRQLWLYNCGIFAGKYKKSVFNLWVEGQAGRGAQEVGSCLRKYIRTHLDDNIQYLTLWSDSCGGQNRNIKMVLLMKSILEESPSLKCIRLRFLLSGHSYLPNDSDFGDVECVLKKQQNLFSPQEYCTIMQTCRKKNPIIVNIMNKEDIVNTKNLEKKITNRKKDVNNEKVNWLKMKEIKVFKEKPHSIFVKTEYNETDNYQEVNIKKGKQAVSRNVFEESPQLLWPEGKPVAQAKLDDIKSYMHLIPAVDHDFYTNIIGDNSIVEDIDGFNGDLDFEVEVEEEQD